MEINTFEKAVAELEKAGTNAGTFPEDGPLAGFLICADHDEMSQTTPDGLTLVGVAARCENPPGVETMLWAGVRPNANDLAMARGMTFDDVVTADTRRIYHLVQKAFDKQQGLAAPTPQAA